jgi:hypothetical protein
MGPKTTSLITNWRDEDIAEDPNDGEELMDAKYNERKRRVKAKRDEEERRKREEEEKKKREAAEREARAATLRAAVDAQRQKAQEKKEGKVSRMVQQKLRLVNQAGLTIPPSVRPSTRRQSRLATVFPTVAAVSSRDGPASWRRAATPCVPLAGG